MERIAVHAMGTRFELVLMGGFSTARLRAAAEEAMAEIKDAHRRLSAFARDSVIAHLNRAAALGPEAGPIPIDGETWRLLIRCGELVDRTNGAFDPGLGRRMVELGFRDEEATGSAFRGGWRSSVRVDPHAPRVSFRNPGMALDLGGMAKGYALDLAADALMEAGIHRALLHGGTSTVLALDPPIGESAWRVALGPEADAPVAHLKRAALSLSDLGGRVAGDPADPTPHVLDPLTGQGATGARRAAVVIPLESGDAMDADAYSTAALVSGPGLQLPGGAELWTLSEGPRRVDHIVPPGMQARILPPRETDTGADGDPNALLRCTAPIDEPY